jgi:hypothetical protein
MVLPLEASQGREEQAYKYLAQLAELTQTDPALLVRRGEDVAETILDAGADADLIVLGAARPTWRERVVPRHLVGRIADEIAERAEGSVLVSKDPAPRQAMSSRLGRWIRAVGRAVRGEREPWDHPVGEPVPDVKVRPFPRD